MATEILMPALSPTMEEGTLAKWLVKEGDTVSAGDILAEIETDKATMEFEAVDEGVIGRILVAEGTAGVKVNTPIAVMVEEGESTEAPPRTASAKAAPEPAPVKMSPPDLVAVGLQLVETASAKEEPAAATAAPDPARRRRSRPRADTQKAAEPLVMVETRSAEEVPAEPSTTPPAEWGPPSNPRRRARPKHEESAAEPLVLVETKAATQEEATGN